MRKKNFLLFPVLALLMAVSCAQESEPLVVIHTDYGDMKVRLYDSTPRHRDNFIKLVKEGFYDNLLFHRVIPQFMIQGGDPDSRNAPQGALLGNGDIGYYIPNEFDPGIVHKKGVIAAARDNNPELASSGCQFYIVQGQVFTDDQLDYLEQQYGGTIPPEHREIYKTIGGTPHLYLLKFTVFGEVVEGLEVIDKIAGVPTDQNDRPLKNIRMWISLEK